MRPLTLTMQAFGPFSGKESIDFSKLGDNPLFLINGPTGSGKTTILDALCFALYGKTTGDERDGTQMRCDLAPDDLLTEVIFEFELARNRYRIRRIPEQLRPKSRGEGFTSQSPEAQLYQIETDGREKLLVSSKVTEATRMVEDLTGLSVDQFRQVMVLPQGKFRQLLLAESAEREKIFSQLFQTRIYKRLEDRLKEHSAGLRRQREDLQQLRQGILEAADLETLEQLEQERSEVEQQTTQALSCKLERERQHQAASESLQQGRSLLAQFAQLEKVADELERLQQQTEQIDSLQQKLRQAELAAKLSPLYADWQRCQQDLLQAGEAVKRAQAELVTKEKELSAAQSQLSAAQARQPEIDRLKQELAQLEAFRVRAERLHAARERLQAAQRQTSMAELWLHWKQLVDREQQLRQVQKLERACQAQEQLLEKKQHQGGELAKKVEDLQRSTRQIELDWHRGQAAILAAELQPGTPCPVCGSQDHPAPAQSKVVLPTQSQLEQARSAAEQAQHKLMTAREEYKDEQNRLRELRHELKSSREGVEGGDTVADELAMSAAQLQDRAAELQVRLPDSGQAQSLNLRELDNQLRQAKDTLVEAKTQLAAAEQELPEAYRQPGALEQAEQSLRQQLGQLEQAFHAAVEQQQAAHGWVKATTATLSAARQQEQTASEAATQAVDAWQAGLQQSPFTSAEDYRAAQLTDSEMGQCNEQIEKHKSAVQNYNGARKQLEESLQGKQPPEIDELEQSLQAVTELRDQAVSAWQQLDKRLSQLNKTAEKLTAAAKDLQQLDAQYAVIGTLSDVANGQTGNKISLQRFVLSVLLDDVLIEASQRLSLMSKGRYQLLRKEDRSKGNKASGLELEVEDAYTGKVRSVATLSGGESFMAALSLALGLSDVVQAYAGGIRLDTLFIDEGFGSLDPESLDLAVRTLIDLQSTGRMVGVISHVADLKEQLPLRIDVLSERFGSSTRLVTI